MNLSEKASYLKGLFEGLKYNKESDEGKLFAAIIDLLDDISLSVLDIEDEQETLNDYVEEIDDDLAAIEDDFYGDDDCCCDCDDDCDCDDCDCCNEICCPECDESIFVDEDTIKEGKIICPSCNAEIELD